MICTKVQAIKIKISNPNAFERIDEIVTLFRSNLVFDKCAANQVPVVICNSDTIESQIIDNNNDLKWDELLLVLDFKSKESKVLTLCFVDKKFAPKFIPHTNIRFAKRVDETLEFEEFSSGERSAGKNTEITQKYFQFEGPGWENDRIACRNYFDERNGIDLFGKVRPEMVLDLVGIKESYHEMHNWGMDILKVGNSLGAGALAFKTPSKLVRVSQYKESSFDIKYEGVLQSKFDLSFKNFTLDSQLLDIHHIISISAGKFYYNNEIQIKGETAHVELVAGIVNLHSDSLYVDNYNGYTICSTYAKQSYNSEYLGLAIVLKQSEYSGCYKTPNQGEDITNTFAVKIQMNSNPTLYRFYSCWELTDKRFSTKEGFDSFLKCEIDKIINPVVIE